MPPDPTLAVLRDRWVEDPTDEDAAHALADGLEAAIALALHELPAFTAQDREECATWLGLWQAACPSQRRANNVRFEVDLATWLVGGPVPGPPQPDSRPWRVMARIERLCASAFAGAGVTRAARAGRASWYLGERLVAHSAGTTLLIRVEPPDPLPAACRRRPGGWLDVQLLDRRAAPEDVALVRWLSSALWP